VNVFPVLSFESEGEGIWLPTGAGVIHWNDLDLDDRGLHAHEVDPATLPVTRTADTSVGRGGGGQVGDTHVEVRRTPDAQTAGEVRVGSHRDPRGQPELSESHSAESQARGALSTKISSYGLPHVYPGDFISIINLGIFSGNYGILGLTHRAEAGSFSTSFDLLSNALLYDAVATILSANVEGVNDQPAVVQESATSGGGYNVEPEPDDPLSAAERPLGSAFGGS
jgi:hypothetical protein